MEQIPHPSTYIAADDVATIRRTAADAEEIGMLTEEQLQIVYQQKWFRLLVPKVYGGVEITLPELVRLQEAISWADGSIGWTVTLCSGAGWFGGFLFPNVAHQVFSDPQVCLAGSGASTGTAAITTNGYILNGTWKYASGAHHATHFTANCAIEKDGEVVLDQEGKPWILPFIIDKKDVTLLNTWKYIGMVATGSQSFAVESLQVADDRYFNIDAAYAEVLGPLYQYPFRQLAEATLAVNLSGMAMHFVDLCEKIFAEKQRGEKLTNAQKEHLQSTFSQQSDNLNIARNNFFTAVDGSWPEARAEQLTNVTRASRALAKKAQECVDTLYPYCGLKAAAPDTEINRVWRDMHTASQHALLTFDME